jgi:mono/diheme cytochrome c family protein
MKKITSTIAVAIAITLLSACNGNSGQNDGSGSHSKSAELPGAGIYKRTCITCHMANGEGIPGTYPPLAKSDYFADKEKTIQQVIKGSSGEMTVNGKKYNNTMIPQQLTDEEIADVLTFVFSNFGNNNGAVTAAEVKAVRAKS